MWLISRKSIENLQITLPREQILRRSRILVVDDERPDIIEDLKSRGFSIDYVPDLDKNNMHMIEVPIYDLVLLDFGNVGAGFGHDQGLSLLKYIRRVNPAIVVLAYTSKALGTQHADFYRLADGVLGKDAGIQDSMEKIEDALRKAHSIENVWRGLLAISGIEPGSKEDVAWQDLLVRGLTKPKKIRDLKTRVMTVLGNDAAQKIGLALLSKVFELAIKAAAGL